MELNISEPPDWLISAVREEEVNAAHKRKEARAGSAQAPEEIQEGSRNDTLTHLAGYLRRKGFTKKEMSRMLGVVNERGCKPPIDEGEIASIAKSVARYEPEESIRENGQVPGSELTESKHAHEYEGPHSLGWNSPLSLAGGHESDPLPVEVLPEWLEEFIRAVSEFVQVPRDIPTLLVLSMLAGALQKKAEIQVRPGWREALTLWGAGVLPSGERKSPVYRKVTKPIREHERELQKELETQYLKATDKQEVLETRLQKAKRKAARASDEDREATEEKVQDAREALQDHEVPPPPKLWIDDTTSEKLLELLERHHGRMLVMSPEGDVFKFMLNRYNDGGSVLNVYKKSWTGREAIRDDRVTRDGRDVPNPALSVGICVQPQVLEDLAQKRTFRGEGIIARFLFVVPEPKAGYRKTGRDVPPMDAAAQARYEKKLTELLELDPESIEDGDYVPYTLRLEEEARPVLWEFEEELEKMLRPDGRLDGMKDWGNKLVGQTLRIAGLLHIAETGELDGRIPPDTLRRAIRLGRAFIPHARAAYGLLNVNEKVRLARYVFSRICETMGLPGVPNITGITRNGEDTGGKAISGDFGDSEKVGPITKRQLWQATKGKSDINEMADLRKPFEQLVEHNLIQIVKQNQGGPGRNPSPEIFLNPAIVSK